MTKFAPTPEQLAIINAAKDTKDNLIISALAGAAKTSTLVMIAEALPDTQILCLAFNKKIAVEMAERLPANCTSSTLNAIGHRVWADTIGARLRLDKRKTYSILRNVIEEQAKDLQEPLWKAFRDLLSTFREAKRSGMMPDKTYHTYAKRRPVQLRYPHKFFAECEFNLSELEQDIITQCMEQSYAQSFAGIIDFDDQILMPAVFRSVVPIHPLVLVDEAQDLSPLNHQFIRKLARYRLIAVGDPCQAIYGFRGADEDSMTNMQSQFSMVPFTLSTSFRCPPEIVKHVKWRAPHMQAWEGNPHEGSVLRLGHWNIPDIPDQSAIICRNNAPLFSLAIEFLKAGRYPKLLSGEIATRIVSALNSLGPKVMLRDDALTEVTRWAETNDKRSRARKTTHDIAECMRVFLSQTTTLGDAIAFAEELKNYEGPVQFMTGHKAKGLEFNHVFFLDEKLVDKEGQDRNLRYVICTRSLNHLTYINSDELIKESTNEEF